jgi:ankyrin repeat protein
LAISLAENLFSAAVEACDTQAIRIIAQTMEGKGAAIDVNNVVCHFQDRKYTPLELAAKLRNLDTIQLLIKMSADPNKTHEDDTDFERCALERAFRMRSKEYEPLDENIIQVLLQAGSAVRSTLLSYVARWDASLQVQKDLVKRISPKNHIEFMQKLDYLINHLDNNVALELTETLIRFCEESKCFRCITVITCSSCIEKQRLKGLGLCLVVASRRANLSLCKILLRYVRPGVEALTAAFWGEDPATIHLITEHGATASSCVVSLGCYFGGKDVYKDFTTILAEAIYSQNPSLMLLAKQLGVWKFAKESELYMANALKACADVGDSETMIQLLETCQSVKGLPLGTMLCIAVHNGYQSIISLLLSAGASVNTKYEHIVILDIIKRRNQTAIEMILESDIDIDESWNLGHAKEFALELAGLWGDISVIKDLLDMGFQTDFGIHTTALAEAVRSGAMDVIELLLRYGADPNASASKGNSPLHEAVKKGDERMIRYLLSHGANPADIGAFLEASKQQKETLNILLAAFVSKYPNGKKGFGAEILIEAIKVNDKKLFKTLLEARIDIHGLSKSHGCTPLGAAIRKDGGHNFDLVADILKAGESVESIVAAPFGLGGSTISGSSVWPQHTALLEAIETRNEEMVKLILENGANVNRPARRGIKRTPLQRACEIGSYTIVQLLIDHRANVDDQPSLRGGGTALQLASGAGSIKIVLLLLFHKARIDGPTSAVDGRSALEAAAASGRLDLLKILWECTQGRGFHTQEVERAVGFAKAKGYQACVNCLEELHSASQREFDVSGTLVCSV